MKFTIKTADNGTYVAIELPDGTGICWSPTGLEVYGHGESTEYEIVEGEEFMELRKK